MRRIKALIEAWWNPPSESGMCYDCFHRYEHHTKQSEENSNWDMGCSVIDDNGVECSCFMFFPKGL